MSKVWCVRADFGTYARHFVDGGYVAIGWIPGTDLSNVRARDDLYALYKQAHPDDTSNVVIGQQVGQIARFLLEIKAGDHVITPASDTEWLHHGTVQPDPSYVYAPANDGCPYPHRRRITWATQRIKRADFSVPFQNTIRSSLTVFAVSQQDEFLAAIGRSDLVAQHVVTAYDPYRVVLDQVLELDPKEFEILVGHLLTALGFEGSEVTGKTGDGGVDATGELNVGNLAKVKVFVQAKRYKVGTKINAGVVRQLRQAIPFGGQGAFITTADFQSAAADVALEPGFPRIGLVNGRQLVDLLIEHWPDIPTEFRDRLGLKPGLVRT
ncbi:MAG: restriction endonuclease [Aquabacterium sp.]|uniref:restriction endonuclease n=1 Tax=Aquabacterium sp. TaxID=1872578 RepID=UPI002725E20D|nr:restriction endonuclease [Aquabacterium sp.]MDO9003398.1 restriction endonuclease [Aquabacterium sp.]